MNSHKSHLQYTPLTGVKKLQHVISNGFTFISLGLLWCIGQLPHTWLLKLGQWIGVLMYHVLKRRTSIARRNIQACFPELDAETHERITRNCIIENIRGLFESAKAWWGNTQSLLDVAEVHGIDIIQEAASSGKGVLLVGAHFTTLDMAGRIIAELWPLTILYRPFNNAHYDQIILKARQRVHPHVIDKNRMRDLVRNIQQGGTLWYPADQDYGKKDSVFAPFFGIEAASLATTAGLAKLCKGNVVGLYHHRLPDNRYRIEFVTMDNFPIKDTQAAATQANKMIETGIRLFPEQYMWVHRRFKTRPHDEKNFYSE